MKESRRLHRMCTRKARKGKAKQRKTTQFMDRAREASLESAFPLGPRCDARGATPPPVSCSFAYSLALASDPIDRSATREPGCEFPVSWFSGRRVFPPRGRLEKNHNDSAMTHCNRTHWPNSHVCNVWVSESRWYEFMKAFCTIYNCVLNSHFTDDAPFHHNFRILRESEKTETGAFLFFFFFFGASISI